MKIAVSQREIILKNSIGDSLVFDGIERSWYKFLSSHTLIAIGNTIKVDSALDDIDCLLLTGGPDSYARHMTENSLYKLAVERNIPIVGICHGAFAINDLSGGVNGRCKGHIGTTHSIYMEDLNFIVNSYHSQSIKSLGPNMVALAVDTDNHIEAFKHTSKPIYGIVWHPERMDTSVLPYEVSTLFL